MGGADSFTVQVETADKGCHVNDETADKLSPSHDDDLDHDKAMSSVRLYISTTSQLKGVPNCESK